MIPPTAFPRKRHARWVVGTSLVSLIAHATHAIAPAVGLAAATPLISSALDENAELPGEHDAKSASFSRRPLSSAAKESEDEPGTQAPVSHRVRTLHNTAAEPPVEDDADQVADLRGEAAREPAPSELPAALHPADPLVEAEPGARGLSKQVASSLSDSMSREGDNELAHATSEPTLRIPTAAAPLPKGTNDAALVASRASEDGDRALAAVLPAHAPSAARISTPASRDNSHLSDDPPQDATEPTLPPAASKKGKATEKISSGSGKPSSANQKPVATAPEALTGTAGRSTDRKLRPVIQRTSRVTRTSDISTRTLLIPISALNLNALKKMKMACKNSVTALGNSCVSTLPRDPGFVGSRSGHYDVQQAAVRDAIIHTTTPKSTIRKKERDHRPFQSQDVASARVSSSHARRSHQSLPDVVLLRTANQRSSAHLGRELQTTAASGRSVLDSAPRLSSHSRKPCKPTRSILKNTVQTATSVDKNKNYICAERRTSTLSRSKGFRSSPALSHCQHQCPTRRRGAQSIAPREKKAPQLVSELREVEDRLNNLQLQSDKPMKKAPPAPQLAKDIPLFPCTEL